jgi:4-alpha-glucanotransferase
LVRQAPEILPDRNEADFEKALKLKGAAIDEAFDGYVRKNSPLLQKRFEIFCNKEGHWLEDYALFTILKQEFNNEPWNKWPHEFKIRKKESLEAFAEKHAPDLTLIKFGQYLFSSQFKKIKKYANTCGIKIVGDVPIYVSYDSADVWANPQLFNLGRNLEMITVAGVPPDYFSETGQLWNMPVYKWQIMDEDGYSWWKTRISRNLEFCDMLRFDHFRGFASYWEVPAGETTAVNGQWTQGPGEQFFTELKKNYPEMPFIAEDLGDINEDVYNLRDAFALPGMRVLQFAFGGDMARSVHIPHNHAQNSIVYTGTHDNNTINGWYRKEVNREMKSQIKTYFNHKLNAQKASYEFIRLALGSVARIAIIPMQDLLNLDETARFNTPSQAEGNWKWKLTASDSFPAEELKKLTVLYGRDNQGSGE